MSNASKKLAGKVALVTGGSRGIGAAIARALADDGADVAISYSASADKAKAVVNDLLAKGVRAHAFRADQANPQEVNALVKSVVERFGHLDILVNNAGVFATGQVHDRANNLSELDHLFAVNVGGRRAPLYGPQRALLSEGGRIISIGSVVGERSPFPGIGRLQPQRRPPFSVTRAAGPAISAQGASPSTTCSRDPIDTDMNPAGNGDFRLPSRRPPRSDVMASLRRSQRLLPSSQALRRAYITGATLTVDGGFNA